MDRQYRAALVTALSQQEHFPREIETSLLMSLPICIVKVGRLSVETVHAELNRRGISVRCAVIDRPLRGCLVAQADLGLVFVDSTDPADEQNFSLAHEASHLIVDYLEPRVEALGHFGERVRPVLDGHRPPSPEEQIDAFLARVPLGAHVHLMDRGPASGVARCESRADQLAFEMLAPAAIVRTRLQGVKQEHRLAKVHAILVSEFGLPADTATVYSALLVPDDTVIPLRKLLNL